MRFKSLTNDQTVPRYRYFNFYKPHKVDGKGFSSQMPTLKTVPSDQKSNRRTCAEECQMPFKGLIRFFSVSVCELVKMRLFQALLFCCCCVSMATEVKWFDVSAFNGS